MTDKIKSTINKMTDKIKSKFIKEEDKCDFCDKKKHHLVKRDAGYDEWTCKECFKEQYEDEEEEE